jgi:hypothetical protein
MKNRGLIVFFCCALFAIPEGAPAIAAQIWSADGNYGFQDVFQISDSVYVSGDLDYVDPGFDLFPDANIYIMANRTWTGNETLIDLTPDGADQVIGSLGGGAFFDELVWLQPLVAGYYDIIADVNEDGIYNSGLDILDGSGASAGFRVVPLPASIILIISGLTGLAVVRRKVKK